jgi:magnesium transporter
MRIYSWEDNKLEETSIEALKDGYKKKLWFDITDTNVEDLEHVAEALRVPRNTLIGKLSSNYPHVDSYPDYTKVFIWHLNKENPSKDITGQMGPVIVFTNGQSVVTISHAWTRMSEAIASGYSLPRFSKVSPITRVIYLALDHSLETYEHYVDVYEAKSERLEDHYPPWQKHAYMEAFEVQRETSSLLRLLRHLSHLAESLVDDHTELGILEEEKRLFDLILERVTGAVETTEVTHETMRDLIGIHMDTLSNDMSKTMRLIAALTIIIGVPSLITNLLSINLTQNILGASPIVEIVISVSAMALLGVFFYFKGWLKIE